MKEVTVTELARGLSDFINRASSRGESFVIMRGGKAVAQIVAHGHAVVTRNGDEFRRVPGLAVLPVEL